MGGCRRGGREVEGGGGEEYGWGIQRREGEKNPKRKRREKKRKKKGRAPHPAFLLARSLLPACPYLVPTLLARLASLSLPL
jgi:hypothetical protein